MYCDQNGSFNIFDRVILALNIQPVICPDTRWGFEALHGQIQKGAKLEFKKTNILGS